MFFCKRSPRVAKYLHEPLSLERLCCGLVAIWSGRGSQDAARSSWASVKTGQSIMKTSKNCHFFMFSYADMRTSSTYICTFRIRMANSSRKSFAAGRCVTKASPKLEWRRKCSPRYESVEEYEGYDWKDNVEDGGQPEHVDIQVPAGFSLLSLSWVIVWYKNTIASNIVPVKMTVMRYNAIPAVCSNLARLQLNLLVNMWTTGPTRLAAV